MAATAAKEASAQRRRGFPGLIGLVCGSLIFGLTGSQAQETEIRRLVIGLDLSKSNPLTTNAAYAAKLADWVGDEIRSLRLGAVIHVRTFGVSDATRNTLRIDEQVTLRNSPETIAAGMETLISSVPDLVGQGKLEVQSRTNIVGFIRTNINFIGECQTPTKFILLTDGIEDSEYGNLHVPGGIVRSPAIKPPQDKRYKCEQLVLLGLGQGLNGQQEKDRLRTIWTAWVNDSAPFKNFVALDDW